MLKKQREGKICDVTMEVSLIVTSQPFPSSWLPCVYGFGNDQEWSSVCDYTGSLATHRSDDCLTVNRRYGLFPCVDGMQAESMIPTSWAGILLTRYLELG